MTTRARFVSLFGAGLLSVAVSACKTEEPSAASAAPTASAAAASTGTKHDPPIQKDAVPAGHWYCDMGTVHYSQPEQGDGTCPTCHMKLVQKK